MKFTLSLNADLVSRVRKIAVERETTLTALIREYLEEVAAEDSAPGRKRREREALEQSFQRFQFTIGKRNGLGTTCMPAPDLAGQMPVSTQVLAGYAAVLLHNKMSPPAPPKHLKVILINGGQKYFGIVVENPFRDAR